MKAPMLLAMAVLCAAPLAWTQAPAAQPEPAEAKANPVVWSANQIYTNREKNILASADAMPAEKYTYKPTPDQWTFAKIVSHIAASNGAICGALSGNKAPDTVKAPETAPKAELMAAMKASFDFCDATMAALTDAKLSDPIPGRGGMVPRARLLIEITADLPDHYSQMAGYLRLNGILPPSAQPRK